MHRFILFLIVTLALTPSAFALEAPHDQLQNCLKKAADMPDIAAAEADAWVKHKGGDPALLCRATAEFHRGDFLKSADDFNYLASVEKDNTHTAFLYQQSGLAYTRVANYPKAEDAYDHALKLENQDPDIWINRANMRAAAQRYWDAIDDLNQALTIMPDTVEALTMRGQVWFKLGMDAKAESDFSRAALVQAEEDVSKTKASAKPVTKKN